MIARSLDFRVLRRSGTSKGLRLCLTGDVVDPLVDERRRGGCSCELCSLGLEGEALLVGGRDKSHGISRRVQL